MRRPATLALVTALITGTTTYFVYQFTRPPAHASNVVGVQFLGLAPGARVFIDGVRVDWPDGFGLVRASNTTPVLVLRFEGHTPEALQRIEAEMLALLRSVKPDAQLQGAAH